MKRLERVLRERNIRMFIATRNATMGVVMFNRYEEGMAAMGCVVCGRELG